MTFYFSFFKNIFTLFISPIQSIYRSPTFLIGFGFHVLINAPIFSGLLIYGDDTGGVDIPFRTYASAIFANYDLPLWYPNAGNGIPQISIEFVGNVFNPVGLLIAYFRPYDFLSFAVENSLWRIIGYVGVFLFAKTWGLHPIGATAIAVTYIGTGTMSRAALALAVFIGQMLAPWLLLGASSAILSQSRSQLLTSAGIIGLTAGIMSWSGGLVVILMAPVLLGPTLIALALQTHRGVSRLFFSLIFAIVICFFIASPIVSQTLTGPTNHFSPTYRAKESDMLAGHVKSVDFLGFFLVNPSYILEHGTDDLRPLYTSIIPIILIILTTPPFSRQPSRLLLCSVIFVIFTLINSQNWHFFDTFPLAFFISPFDYKLLINTLRPVFFLVLPIVFLSNSWGLPIHFSRLDKTLLFGALWIIVLATNNPFANYLRQNIPPFALVRHNYFYFWIVSLYLIIIGWSRFESIISHFNDHTTSDSFFHTDDIRSLTRQGVARSSPLSLPLHRISLNTLYIGFGVLLIVFLSAHGNRESTTRPSFELVGGFHLLWQLFLFFFICIFLGFSLTSFNWLRASRGLFLVSISSFALLLVIGAVLRAEQYVPSRIPLSDIIRLSIDLFHMFFFVVILCISLCVSKSKTTARFLLCFIIISDILLAIPRYLSDNERFATPQLGWPFTLGELKSGNASSLIKPDRGDGSLKSHFWLPFRGAMRTYPEVRLLRAEWGDAYNQWMHFPTYWYEDSLSNSAFVPFEALTATNVSTDATRTPTWGLPGEEIGGRGEPQASTSNLTQKIHFPSDEKLIPAVCDKTSFMDTLQSNGRIISLLPTHVTSDVIADCDRLMVFTDSWAQGWSLRIDGSPVPILKINGAIRGAHVPSGSHILTWEYVTPYRNILLLSVLIGSLLSFIFIFRPTIIPTTSRLSDYLYVSKI